MSLNDTTIKNDEQDLRHQPTEQRRTYEDEYDDYADDSLEAEPEPFEPPAAAVTPIRPSVRPVESAPATAMQRIQTIHPRSYNDAKAIGTAFRDGIPVIMNLSAMDEANSKRLVEVAHKAGCPYAQLVQTAGEIDWRALDGVRSIGLTAGASAPEHLVNGVIDAFRARYEVTVRPVVTAEEDVEFKVPRILREPA